jgi:hypothetical protein
MQLLTKAQTRLPYLQVQGLSVAMTDSCLPASRELCICSLSASCIFLEGKTKYSASLIFLSGKKSYSLSGRANICFHTVSIRSVPAIRSVGIRSALCRGNVHKWQNNSVGLDDAYLAE